MLKTQNHKDKYKVDYQEKSEHGGHYYRRLRTTKQNKANNALDRALRQRDFTRIRADDDEYDYY
jgi:hypothetical protein